MSIITKEIHVCDRCHKELMGRLTFRVCPCCKKEICLACIAKEDARHKPRDRKPKPEQVSIPPGETIPEPKKRGHHAIGALAVHTPPARESQGVKVDQPDVSSFRITVPASNDEPYTLRIGELTVKSMDINEGLEELMRLAGITEGDINKAPDSQGKTELLAILEGERR